MGGLEGESEAVRLRVNTDYEQTSSSERLNSSVYSKSYVYLKTQRIGRRVEEVKKCAKNKAGRGRLPSVATSSLLLRLFSAIGTSPFHFSPC